MSERPVRMAVAGIHWPPETFLQRMLLGLADSGVELTIIGPVDPAVSGRNDLKWVRAPAWEGAHFMRVIGLARQWAAALSRNARQTGRFHRAATGPAGFDWALFNRVLPFVGRRWDLIYFPWNTGAIACLPVFDLDVPVVISCRGAHVNVAPHNPDRADIESGLRETFRRAAAVHCVSEDILEGAMKFGLSRDRARVIRPAVDPEDFSPRENGAGSGDGFHVATTGSLIWRKGAEYALAAFKRLIDSGADARFHFIGDGPERQRVTYTAADMGVADRVILHGKLPAAKVRALLQRMDAFVLASLSEGISNAVLEAMACGLPVVTTDCGGMREAVEDGIDGFVVPVRDPASMADRLIALAADPELRTRVGRAARRRVIEQFSLADQVRQWRELIDGVVGAKARARAS